MARHCRSCNSGELLDFGQTCSTCGRKLGTDGTRYPPAPHDDDAKGIDWAGAESTATVTWERQRVVVDGVTVAERLLCKSDERQERRNEPVIPVQITSIEFMDDPHPDRPSRVRISATGYPRRGEHWLDRIEALKEGDECEVKSYADGAWHRGIVKHNGGAGFWVVEVLGDRWHRHIENVRCVGQTEAWSR